MKSKKIPEDIKRKSIKEAQIEINEIISRLENHQINLEESANDYNKMMILNNHIQEEFKKKARAIKVSKIKKTKNSLY